MKKFLLICLALFFSSSLLWSIESEGYRIEVTIENLSDTTCFLGYHLGNRQFLQDTAEVDANGFFVFEGKERLPGGMYLVILPENKYFELIVDQNQRFSVHTHKENLIENMTFDNSPENTSFYDYMHFLRNNNHEATILRNRLESGEYDEEGQLAIRSQLTEIDERIIARQNDYMEEFPNGLFSLVLLAQRNPDLSDVTNMVEESDDPNLMYRTYKKRFWDNIDFSDDRILRTPVYHAMMNRYINQFIVQIPDSIMVAADSLIEKARENDEVFRYTLWYLTNNAERSQIMGMDAVFVHLVQKYYEKGDAFWMTDEAVERLSQRAARLEPLLIGRKAPDIFGFSASGQRIALHEVEADYLVLYFWESDCSHCRRETPILKDVYRTHKENGLDVFAMNVEVDTDKWQNAVESYGLTWINVNDIRNQSGYRDTYDVYAIPLIYLLDAEKKIIAKKVSADQLNGFMEFELNRKSQAD